MKAERLIYEGTEKIHIDNSGADGEPFDLMGVFELDGKKTPVPPRVE